LGTPASSSQADCGVPTNWTIQYTRSGGFVGLEQSLTLKSDGSLKVQNEKPPADETKTVSSAQLETISNQLVRACPFTVEATKGVCADCYSYELTIQMDGRTYTVEAIDTTLTEELRPLINALGELFPTVGQ
jgi:hypothetical protein